MKYKYIIWDWNGTLLDDLKICVDIINEILINENKNPLSIDKYKEIFTFPVVEYYKKAGLDISNGNFERLGKYFIKRYEEEKYFAELHKKSIDILEFFYSHGAKQYILSAYSQNSLVKTVNDYKIINYFEKLVGLNHIYANSKLENGVKLASLLSDGKILLIGDTLHDLEVANKINADCFLVSHGHQSFDVLNKEHGKVYNSFIDIINGLR